MKYYFFKTVRDGSRNRLNPLPFQTASDGTAIIQKLNTQVAAGGMKLREAYPIGTVFCSSMCELSARAGTPYYCAGDIYAYDYPINVQGNSHGRCLVEGKCLGEQLAGVYDKVKA